MKLKPKFSSSEIIGGRTPKLEIAVFVDTPVTPKQNTWKTSYDFLIDHDNESQNTPNLANFQILIPKNVGDISPWLEVC